MLVLITMCVFLLNFVCCEVLWAINCGGDSHVDVNGIKYQADFLKVGVASDYGRSFTINRIPTEDQIIYQTERYHTDDFSYPVPVIGDGNYVISLKFSEVWFTERNEKVFSVLLQNSIPIINSLDIFGEVGFATALEYHVPFKIKNKNILCNDQSVQIPNDHFIVDFIKTQYDNPKINAIVLTRGSMEDVPLLPPLQDEIHKPTAAPKVKIVEDSDSEAVQRRPARTPRASDPYESVESSYLLLPILATIGAFLPILFCLCKL